MNFKGMSFGCWRPREGCYGPAPCLGLGSGAQQTLGFQRFPGTARGARHRAGGRDGGFWIRNLGMAPPPRPPGGCLRPAVGSSDWPGWPGPASLSALASFSVRVGRVGPGPRHRGVAWCFLGRAVVTPWPPTAWSLPCHFVLALQQVGPCPPGACSLGTRTQLVLTWWWCRACVGRSPGPGSRHSRAKA